MNCNCVDMVNRGLADSGGEINVTVTFSGHHYVTVETVRKVGAKRGKTPRLIATFCPFCGRNAQHPEVKP